MLDNSGNYAQSSSAKMAFYTNAAENPRLCEIYEATMRKELDLVFRTYFAVNPDWLDKTCRRVPGQDEVESEAEIQTLVAALVSTEDSTSHVKVPAEFAIHSDGSNFEFQIARGNEQSGIYYIDFRIILRTEWEADTEALNTFVARLSNPANGDVVDDKAIVYRDLSIGVTKPWTSDYKAV